MLVVCESQSGRLAPAQGFLPLAAEAPRINNKLEPFLGTQAQHRAKMGTVILNPTGIQEMG